MSLPQGPRHWTRSRTGGSAIAGIDVIAGLVLALAISCALLFGTVRLAHRSLWLDEAYSIYISSASIGGLLTHLTKDNGPPAYYAALHFWMGVFGSSEAAARSLSALFYLAGSAAIFALGRYLFGRYGALWCGVLYLASPLAVAQSQNARMYALLGLLVIVSTFCLFKLVRERSGLLGWGIAYVGVNATGTLTHYWFFFVLIAQAVAALVLASRSGRARVWLSILLSMLPFTAFWSPVFLVQLQNESTYWFPRVGMARALWDTCCDFFGSRGAALILLAAGVSVAIGGTRLKAAGVFMGLRKDKTLLALATMLAVSVFVPLGISTFKPIYCAGRYMMVALPVACLLLGGFLDRVGQKAIVSGLCCALLLLASARAYRERTAVESGSDRITGNYLGAAARDGDILVFTSLSRLPVEYYVSRAAGGKRIGVLSFPAALGESPALLNPQHLAGNQAGLQDESKALVAKLAGAIESGAGVWLVGEKGNSASELLRADLEKYHNAVRVVPLAGLYHDEVRLYGQFR
jgi:mannosyltransferase